MNNIQNKKISLSEKLESHFGSDGHKKILIRWNKISKEINSKLPEYKKFDESELMEIDIASLISGTDPYSAYINKIVDGSRDGGIDAVHMTSTTLYLIQTKLKGKQWDDKRFHDAPIRKMIDTYDNYFKISNKLPVTHESLKRFIKEYNSSTVDKVQYIFVSFDSKDDKSILDSYNRSDIRVISYKDLILQLASREWTEKSQKDEFIIRVPHRLKDRANNPKSVDNNLYGMVDGHEFIEQFSQLSDFAIDMLFEKNIRNSVVPKTFVEEIKKTIENEGHYFHLYNNGITIVAKSIEKENNNGDLKIISPQIVNGQQTLRTLISLYKSGVNLSEIKISIKAIEVKDNDELVTKIARFSNNQTAVKKADLKVTTSDYQKIVLAAKGEGYFVEGKKGKNLSDEIVLSLLNGNTLQVNEIIRSHASSKYPSKYLGKSKNAISSVVNEYFDSSNLVNELVEKNTFKEIINSIVQYELEFIKAEEAAKTFLRNGPRLELKEWKSRLSSSLNHLKFGISVFYNVSISNKNFNPTDIVFDIYNNEASKTIDIFKNNESINEALNNSLRRKSKSN